VEIITKSRNVEVKGPLGVLKRSFKHLNYDVIREEDKKTKKKRLLIQMWFAQRKQRAAVTTISSHIKNMIRGVTTVKLNYKTLRN
jgi:large subunit ribosomal protein L9e